MRRILAIFLLLGASLATARAATNTPEYGGTLRLVTTAASGSFDPQINYTLRYAEIYQAMYDGLVTFAKVGGPGSIEVVPDLATNLPKPTDHGTTYVFHLRHGIEFSNGAPVTVQAVVHSFRRLFKVNSPNAGTWYDVIVGGRRCLAHPGHCTLPGLIADPATNTVTFHLRHPDAEFLDQLAVPFGSILPADTPDRDMGTMPIPGTGAYMVKSYDPSNGIVMVRNPHFHQWSAIAQPKGFPNRILYRFGLSAEAQVTAVENGQYDWMYENAPADRLNQMATHYTKQIHITPVNWFFYAPMNVNIPPFNNKYARLAVNYAVNRESAVKLSGGNALATPSCQILPPQMPGYVPYCPFTRNPGADWSAPDWKRARHYMQKSGMIGQKVTVVTQIQSPYRQLGVYLQGVLNRLGFKASVKPISPDLQFTYIQNSNNNVQISITDWAQDYPAPSDFLNVLFSCKSFKKGSDNSINISGFCDPAIDAEMAHAELISLKHPRAGDAIWAHVDRQITRRAVVASLLSVNRLDFVSARLRHFRFSGEYFFLPQLAVIK
ncbi:ABC transporter substrate-binding protein [Acidiphilium sp. AL]|uniref:ABC transporter substrate-binding protein n=1 Tax=Acidiphilium iwatense TaxID=768198 RepID=A0ABS9DUT8_9PROT|nr:MULTISPECIES: ABC transporter substrate-binding protein [Acidiphilium]MCF3946485.1 ABC transporter substrate-binding protein [Acidiphilium iwatense]MCU4158655.1 ABC transporter substrate-binding protein [Acidiphilium sp. AL]